VLAMISQEGNWIILLGAYLITHTWLNISIIIRYSKPRVKSRLRRIFMVWAGVQFIHLSTCIANRWLAIPNEASVILGNIFLQCTTFTLISVFIAKMKLIAEESFITVKVLTGVLNGYINLVIIGVAILLCAWMIEPEVFMKHTVVTHTELAWNGLSSTASQIGYMLGGSFKIVNGQANEIINPQSYRGGILASFMYMAANFYSVIAISMAIGKLGKR
jgi:hypothetical protein